MKKIIPFVLSLIVATNFYSQSSYCTSGGPSNATDSNVESVDLTGSNSTSIAFTGCPGVSGVSQDTSLSVDLIGDSSYTIDVQFGTCGGSYFGYGSVWIDWDEDNTFEASEVIGTWDGTPGPANAISSFTFTVPLFAMNGQTRIRVMQWEDWPVGSASTPLDPCGSYLYGSVNDFTVNISGAFTPTCPKPTNLSTNNTTPNSADLSWTAGGTETQWNIEYSFTGFTLGTGSLSTISVNNPTVTGLNSGSNYDYYVQAVCDTNSTSIWSGPYSFATPCSYSVPPSLENFDSGFPVCWSQDQTDDFDWTLDANGTPSAPTGPSDDVTGGGNYMYIETSVPRTTGDSALLVSENYDLSSLTSPQLTFYSHMFGASIGELSVWITDTSGIAAQVFVKNGDQGNQWNEEIVSLSNYSGIVQFTILGVVSDNGSGTSYWGDIAIDNFEVLEAPTCPKPLSNFFSLSNIFATNGDLSWLTAGNESLWEVQWGANGFPLGNGFIDTTSSNQNFSLTNLLPSTSHDVYVRAICGVGDTSLWSQAVTFTTPCLALTPPQIEDFSTGALPTICWSQAGNGTPSSGPTSFGTSGWTTDGFQNVGFTGAARCNLFTTGDNEWLISPQYDFSTGGPYQIEFDFGVFPANGTSPGTLGSDDRVEVLITRDGGASWSAIRNFNNNYVTSLGGSHEIVALPNDSGTVQFAFWASEGSISDLVNSDVMVDNFEILNMPSCPQVSTLLLNNVSDSSVDLSWFIVGSETSWNIQYGQPGFTIGTGSNLVSSSNTYTLTNLNSANNYDVYVQAICSPTEVSLWVGPLNFTTLENCPAPTNLSDSNTTANSSVLYWTAGGSETSWVIEYGTSGFSQGSGTVVSASTNPYILTGLTSSTDYDYYLRADCGTDTSFWTGPHSFTTAFQCPANAVCGTYNSGDIPSDFDYLANGQVSSCPGTIDVVIPTGYVLDSIQTMYDITATGGAWMSEQRSRIFVPSIGAGEQVSASGTGGNSAGTESYSRMTNFSYGFNATDTISIEMHAGRTWGGSGCNTTYNYVDNGSWMVIAYYSLAPSCLSPYGIAISNLNSTSADVSWVAPNNTDTTYNLQYGTSGFTPGTGTSSIVNGDTSYSITGLIGSTTYDFYIQTLCNSGDSSNLIGPISFTTSIQSPIGISCTTGNPGIMYSEDAENGQGLWTGNFVTSGFGWTLNSGPTGSVGTGPNAAHSGSNYLYFETSGSAWPMNGAIVSPMIDLSNVSGDAELSFWIHAYGADIGTLNVGVSNDSATGLFTNVFSSIGQIQTANADSFINVGVNLANYIGQNIYLEFDYTSGASFAGDIAIDLIEINSCLGCPGPTVLSASNITANSADLSWNAGGTETTWDLEYDFSGFAQGSGTVLSVSSNPYNLSGLNPATSYDYYLRADCGNDSSVWVGPYTFTTPCVTVNAPYQQNFSSGNLPNCWSQSVITGDGWRFTGTPGYDAANNGRAGGTYTWIDFSGTDQGTVMEVIPVDVSNSTTPIIEFDYFNYNSINPTPANILFVEAFDGANWVLVDSIQDNSLPGWNTYNFSLSNFDVNGVVSVRLRGESGGASDDFYNDILVDNLYIGNPATCPQLLSNSINLDTSGTNFVAVSWSGGNNANQWEIEYGITGFNLGNGNSVISIDSNYTITGLNPSTSYDGYIRGICGAGDSSLWIGPFSFTTLFECPPNAVCATYNSGDIPTDDLYLGQPLGSSTCPGVLSLTIPTGSVIDSVRTFLDMTAANGAWMSEQRHRVKIDAPNVPIGPLRFGLNGNAAGTESYDYSFNSMFGYNIGNTVNFELHAGRTWSSGGFNGCLTYNNKVDSSSWTVIAYYGSPQSCAIAYNLATNNISNTVANLSWTSGSVNDSLWHVYLVPDTIPGTSIVPDSSHLIVSTNDTLSLTGLNPSSDYLVYVRTMCSATDSSILSSPLSFSTYPDCPNPGILSLSNKTLNSADISWLPNYSNTSINFEIEYGLTGFTPSNGVIDTTSLTTYSLTGLDTLTNYDFYVRSICDTNNIVSGPFTFTTLQYCPEPDSLIISNITVNSADFNWVAGGFENEWIVEYGPSGYPFGSGTLDSTTVTNYSITNIPASGGGTSYDFYLRGQCSVDGSVWTGPFTFTTLPTCTSPDSLSVSNINAFSVDLSWVAGSLAQSYNIEYGPVGFPIGFGFIDTSNTTSLTLSGLNASSSYEAYVQSNCGVGDSSIWIGPVSFTTGNSCPNPDSLSVSNIGITTADLSWIAGGTETEWNVEYGPAGFPQGSPNIPNVYTNLVTTNSYTITGLLDGVNYDFYVQANCGAGDSSNWVGPFSFTTIPFCQQPTALFADSITSSSAKLSWIAGDTEIEWNIEYGVTGFPQGSGFGVIVPFINNYNLNGLSDGTTYDYYVQAVCGVSDSSLFSGPYTFTTCKDADTTTVSSCASYNWNGNVYNTSGTYAYSYLPILGCGDTVVDILNLTVGSNYSTMDTIFACGSYSWNGNNYSTSGTYTDSIQTTLGCDSIITLILTINNSTIIQDNQTSCDSVYLWNGNLLNLTGSYIDTLQSIYGCDSVVKLNLTLNSSPSSLTSQVICKGDSLKFGAMTYTLAGMYTDTLLSSIGCDSLATLDLSVTELTVSIDTSQANVTANVSGGLGPYSYYWSNGDSSSTLFPDSAGLYQIFVVDANGCASDTATYNVTSVGITYDTKDILNVYPNPNNGQFIISNSEIMKDIIITDLRGKNVYTNKNLNSNYLNIELDYLDGGMYLVNIISKNGIITKSVIIQ